MTPPQDPSEVMINGLHPAKLEAVIDSLKKPENLKAFRVSFVFVHRPRL